MSRPDPAITADLMKKLVLKPSAEAQPAGAKPRHGERHVAAAAPRQAPARTPASHTRTSNRGK